jgi:hypothetical protein
MDKQLRLRIILEKPPTGVDFGLQLGSGNKFEVVQKQRSGAVDLVFTLEVIVRKSKDGKPDFFGPYVQGPNTERFIYLDIGTIAGQLDSEWSRRLKIPLRDISWDSIDKVMSTNNMILETLVPGTARDGGPNCATVKPFTGWHVKAV